ncbi:hypothetical protein QTP86_014116 [Hemibagrus guttatus]|nr:hypothetical protein QTP86_014116 [Hemibagrus guttatus]
MDMDHNIPASGDSLQNTLPNVDPAEYAHLQAVVAQPPPFPHAINPVTYCLALPSSHRISPSFYVSLLKLACHCQDKTLSNNEPPPPLDVDRSLAYRINTLLNSPCHWNWLQYLVDWEGYGPEERSWVDTNDILDPSLVEDFHRHHPNRPTPRSRVHP